MPNRPAPGPSDLDAMSELFEAVLAEQRDAPAKAPTPPPPPAPAEQSAYADMFVARPAAPPLLDEATPMGWRAFLVSYAIYVLGGLLIIGLGVWLLAPEATSEVLADPSQLLDRLDGLLRSVIEVILP